MFFNRKKYEKANERLVEILVNQKEKEQDVKCPICNGTHFTEGYKGDYHFSVIKSSFLKEKECMMPTTFKMCESCGHIMLFAMTQYIALSDIKANNK